MLELAAATAVTVVLAAGHRRAAALLHRPPPALLCLGAFAAVHVVSAVCAPEHAGLALKFSLRMAAAFAFAVACAAAPPRARRWALVGLATAALAAAALAVGEGLGVARLDPWLDLFRERVFATGEGRRATAGATGPNQAAAVLAAGLVAGVVSWGRRIPIAVAFALAIGSGLVFTYSRGGLAAAVAGLLALAWTRRDAARRTAMAAAAATALLASAFLLHDGFRQRIATELAAREYDARYLPLDTRLLLQPNERRTVSVDLVNTGAREWTAAEKVTLNAFLYEWPSRHPAGVWRQPLLRPVAPGGTERVAVAIEAPPRAGTYVLAWDLFALPSAYLSGSRRPPALVPVGVGAVAPASVALPDRAWRRGRLELWRLAVAMWWERPVLGAGPDNFRRLHPRYGGWLQPGFHPMTAHNQFLETAANTGTLGLLALVGALLFAARAALRARDGLCLGLLAAFVVQATVDALLEFTGCYLLFAFAIGSAGVEGAPERTD